MQTVHIFARHVHAEMMINVLCLEHAQSIAEYTSKCLEADIC